MNAFLICVGILFAAELFKLTIIIAVCRISRFGEVDMEIAGFANKVKRFISFASLVGVAWAWTLFYRDVVATGATFFG